MSGTTEKKEPLPSEEPQEVLEQTLVHFEQEHPDLLSMDEWFDAYLADPWEIKFTNELFEAFLTRYHDKNPRIFDYILDPKGHIRILKFHPDLWKKTTSYQTETIVIPDFVYGFKDSPFGVDLNYREMYCICDSNITFILGKNVQDLSYMFRKSLISPYLTLKDWDTSKVTQMDGMFMEANFVQISGLEKFDTSNVVSMLQTFAFYGRKPHGRLTGTISTHLGTDKTIDGLDAWDTSNVLHMNKMFFHSAIQTLDLSKWNTAQVRNMPNMFAESDRLKTINLEGWNMENVRNLTGLFKGCSALRELDVSNWNLKSAVFMAALFQDCRRLETLDVSGWMLPEKVLRSSGNLFEGCRFLKKLELSSWDFSCFSNLTNLFSNCKRLRLTKSDEIMASWDISNVIEMNDMLKGSGITLKDPKKLREHWESKKNPHCDVSSVFNDMIYGQKTSAKELEISDFMPNLGLHYEIFKWSSNREKRREENQ